MVLVLTMTITSLFFVSCKAQGSNNTETNTNGAVALQEFNVNDFIGDWKSDDGWYMHFTYLIENEDDNAVFIYDGERGSYYLAGGTDDFTPNEDDEIQLPTHELGYVPIPGMGAYGAGVLYFNAENQTIIYDGYEGKIVFKRIKSSADLSKLMSQMYEEIKRSNNEIEEARRVIKNNPWIIGRWVLGKTTIEFKENGTVWSKGEQKHIEYNATDETMFINLGGDGPTVNLKNRTIEFDGYFKKQ